MPAKKKKIKKLQEETKQDASNEIDSTEESELVSSKKVIYIEIDDEVTAVYDKVKEINKKHIYIVAPKRSILFQSIVNLKILKRKAEDDKKKIYLVTNDNNGIHLAQKTGITVYSKSTEGKPSLFSTEINDDKLRITPLKASVNSIEENSPTRLTSKKISISEILRKRKDSKSMKVSKIKKAKENKKKKSKAKLVIVSPNKHALIGLVGISFAILLIIIYIALPGSTIILTPAASVLEKSVNITLADYQSNKAELDTNPTHMIASYAVDTTIYRTLTHYATGKKISDKAANSSGKITIINTTNNEWPLVAQTRFQTDEGLVFRIVDAITVPPATNDGLGLMDAFVIADQLDANGLIMGERGNVEASTFFLPGLRESSRSSLYAESYEAMTGGITDYISYITNEDIEAAKSRLTDELHKSANEELQAVIEQKTEMVEGEVDFELLDGDDAVKIANVSYDLLSGLEGLEISEFDITGSVYVSGVYYDRDVMIAILINELTLKKSPQKELLRINEDSTTYRIFEWDDTYGKIKLTANIKGIEQYNIDEDNENGAKLLEKIKNHIVGQNIDNAKLYIQNLQQINKAEIEIWPMWSPTLPNITDNIEFEIRDAVMVE